MKVIFLPNNISSLMSVHIPALRKNGVEAVGYNFSPMKIWDKDNVYNWPKDRGLISQVAFFIRFISDLLSSDVIHWVYGGSSRSTKLMLKFLRLLNKKKFVEFCGSDIRSLEKLCDDVHFYQFDEFSDSFKKCMGVRKTSLETQQRFCDAGFFPLPSYPELIDYIEPTIYKDFELITRSVDFNKLIPAHSINSVPLIVHAPSNPEIKGTKYVNEAAEKLVQEGLAEYKLITGMPHSEAMELIKKSDIVVDQIISGEYGVLAIEGMAFAKPVVCFMRPKVLAYYNKYFDELPIVNANRYDIYEVLKKLVLDEKTRKELGNKGRNFSFKYHNPENAAKRLKQIYQSH